MHTNTYDMGNFLQLLSALRWVFSKRYGFSSFSRFIHVAKEKIPQTAGNGSRKSHVILRIFMQPGPGSFNIVVLTERLEL